MFDCLLFLVLVFVLLPAFISHCVSPLASLAIFPPQKTSERKRKSRLKCMGLRLTNRSERKERVNRRHLFWHGHCRRENILSTAPATVTIVFIIIGIVPYYPFYCHVLSVFFSVALSEAGILISTECSCRSSRSGIALSCCSTSSTVTPAMLPPVSCSTVI